MKASIKIKLVNLSTCVQAKIRQQEEDAKNLTEELDQSEQQMNQSITLKERADRERDCANSEREQTKV